MLKIVKPQTDHIKIISSLIFYLIEIRPFSNMVFCVGVIQFWFVYCRPELHFSLIDYGIDSCRNMWTCHLILMVSIFSNLIFYAEQSQLPIMTSAFEECSMYWEPLEIYADEALYKPHTNPSLINHLISGKQMIGIPYDLCWCQDKGGNFQNYCKWRFPWLFSIPGLYNISWYFSNYKTNRESMALLT